MKNGEKELLDKELLDVETPDFKRISAHIDYSSLVKTRKPLLIKGFYLSFLTIALVVGCCLTFSLLTKPKLEITYVGYDSDVANLSKKEIFSKYNNASLVKVKKTLNTEKGIIMPETSYEIEVLENFKGNFNDQEITYFGGYLSDNLLVLVYGDTGLPEENKYYLLMGDGNIVYDYHCLVEIKGYEEGKTFDLQKAEVKELLFEYIGK